MAATHTLFMARLRKFLGVHAFRVLTMPLDGLPAVKTLTAKLPYLAA